MLKPEHQDSKPELEIENAQLRTENLRLLQENLELKELLAKLRRALYGTKAEAMTKSEADDATQQAGASAAAGKTKSGDAADANDRQTPNADSKPGRRPLPEHLPRETQRYRLVGEERTCSCGCEMTEFSEEASEQLDIDPIRFKVIQHIKSKYICRKCKKMRTAAGPKSLVPGSSYASPNFLAHLIVTKGQYGLPHYRLERMLHEAGIKIDRTTLARLQITAGKLCMPIVDLLADHLRYQDVTLMDETKLQVLKEPGRDPRTKSYMWQFRSASTETKPVVLFTYKQTRAGEHPERFFEGVPRPSKPKYFLVDGYSGYNKLFGMIRAGCWAHARRKFFDAWLATPAELRADSLAGIAIEMIGQLYDIERRVKGASPETRYRERRQHARPLLRQIEQWLQQVAPDVMPKSELGKAIQYTMNQWSALTTYTCDGRLDIDNNASEREIKAFVTVRKNILFADTVAGAEGLATFQSLIRTAVANKLSPTKYLTHLFTQLPRLDVNDSEALARMLPWNLSPDQFKGMAAG